eukprot:scaffold134574_cov19-Prasinocladus_malaysianus.AAC.1
MVQRQPLAVICNGGTRRTLFQQSLHYLYICPAPKGTVQWKHTPTPAIALSKYSLGMCVQQGIHHLCRCDRIYVVQRKHPV